MKKSPSRRHAWKSENHSSAIKSFYCGHCWQGLNKGRFRVIFMDVIECNCGAIGIADLEQIEKVRALKPRIKCLVEYTTNSYGKRDGSEDL